MNKNYLHITDTIYATVTVSGSTIAKMTLSGLSSMQELLKTVCNKLGDVAGLVTVEVRNSTMGWLERRMIRIAAPRRVPVQLTLF